MHVLLQDVLGILKDASSTDETVSCESLNETLDKMSSEDESRSGSNGVSIVTVSSIDNPPEPDPALVQVRASKAEVTHIHFLSLLT